MVKKNILRQTLKEKNLILIELNSLRKHKNVDKLNYLYYELFHKVVDNYDDAINEMLVFLNDNDVKLIHFLAHLIGITYQEKL